MPADPPADPPPGLPGRPPRAEATGDGGGWDDSRAQPHGGPRGGLSDALLDAKVDAIIGDLLAGGRRRDGGSGDEWPGGAADCPPDASEPENEAQAAGSGAVRGLRGGKRGDGGAGGTNSTGGAHDAERAEISALREPRPDARPSESFAASRQTRSRAWRWAPTDPADQIFLDADAPGLSGVPGGSNASGISGSAGASDDPAGEVSGSAPRNARQRLDRLKSQLREARAQCDRKDRDIERLTDELVDARAELQVQRDHSKQLLEAARETYRAQASEVAQRNKEIISKLMAGREELGSRCERLAAELVEARKGAAAASRLEGECTELKTALEESRQRCAQLQATLDDSIQQEKQKILSREEKRRREAVAQAVQKAEREIAARLDPQLQGMLSAHQLEKQKLQASHELDLARVRQELESRHETDALERLRAQRTELLRQHKEELDSLAQRHGQQLAALKKEHQEDLEARLLRARQKLGLEAEIQRTAAENALREQLGERERELNELRKRTDQAASSARQKADRERRDFAEQMEAAKGAYARELGEVRQQYRELAVRLWQANRSEALGILRKERDALLEKMAEEMDAKAREAQAELLQRAADSEAREAALRAELAEATSRLRELEVSAAGHLASLSEAQRALEAERQGRQRDLVEKERKYGEELGALREQLEQEREAGQTLEERITERIRSRVEEVVAARDAELRRVRAELGAERERSSRLRVQLAELSEAIGGDVTEVTEATEVAEATTAEERQLGKPGGQGK